jgi:RimJ/RimL family protein N-acetyltransferase
MPVKSLGFRTDLIFLRFNGEIIERDDYSVILTPSDPVYFWGNFLLFKEAPTAGCKADWEEIFAKEVESKLDVHHRALGWDDPDGSDGDHNEFLEAGYEFDKCVIQTAQAVHPPPKYNRDIEIRPLQGDEWAESIDIQMACKPDKFQADVYRGFRQRRMAQYKEMTETGLGHWFGAFLNGRLVADLGIFADEEVGRFQNVETHPDFRRQGICSTMIHETAQYAFEKMGVETLVIAADVDYHAKEIYNSVGFEPTEYQASLQWFDTKYA